MQGPPTMQKTIQASQNWWAQNPIPPDIVGDQIINYYMTNISGFVATCRRLYTLGMGGVQTRQLSLPGLDMVYEIVQGSDILKLTARPESYPSGAQLQTEINYDGYIVWAHAETGTPYHGPFALFVNEYLIADNLTIPANASGYVVMFGETALVCHSLHDDQNPLKTKPGLVNSISPALADLDTPVGKVKNLPGYFLFDWLDPANPDLDDFHDIVTNAGTVQASTDLTFIAGVQFQNPLKSPLVGSGQNFAYLLPMTSGGASENTAGDYMMAEFYSRDKMTSVTTSWDKTAMPPNGVIFANDWPLNFATYLAGVSYGTGGVQLGFDLTPQVNPPGATPYGVDALQTQMVPQPNGAPTPAGQAVFAEYQQAVIDYDNEAAAYVQAVIAAINALNTATTTWTAAYTAIGTTYQQGQSSADAQFAADSTAAIAATTADGAAAVAYENNMTGATLSAWQTAAAALFTAQQAWGERGAFLATGNPTLVAKYDAYVSDSSALLGAKQAYMGAAGTGPPAPPTPPTYADLTAGYKTISGFNYRNVTMAGDQWNFGPWTQPGQ